MAPALEKSKKSLSTVLFLTVPGGGMARTRRACRTADWLLAFLSLHVISALLVGQGVSFSSSFWDHCVWKQTFGWQAQTPGALQRSKASRDCRFRHHPSLAWQNERMHVSVPSLLLPSCCPTSPPFLSVAWSIFRPSILLGCRVLTKERHSAMSESSGWCGRQGGASKMLNMCTILYHLWNMYKKQCTFWNNKYLFNFWITASRSLKQNQKETDFPVIAAGKIFSV